MKKLPQRTSITSLHFFLNRTTSTMCTLSISMVPISETMPGRHAAFPATKTELVNIGKYNDY